MAMLKFSMYRKFLPLKPIIQLLILLYRVCVSADFVDPADRILRNRNVIYLKIISAS